MLRFLTMIVCVVHLSAAVRAGEMPFLKALATADPPKFVCYTPAELDPRQPGNNLNLSTSSLRKDLETLRPYFDGLILYGYHEACTPRILHLARELKFRGVLLGIWQPRSVEELDGTATLVNLFHNDLLLAVNVGNEGITFHRYEEGDLIFAADRLRRLIPETVPLTTSEPLVGYKNETVLQFGDFLAPNIHPVFDRPQFAPKEAANWAKDEALKLAESTGKVVLLKETGFPHGGREPFSPQSQRDFWSAYRAAGPFVTRGKAGVFLNVGFEAFDLPWKAEASGLPIEKSWGLFDQNRNPWPAAEVWRDAPRTSSRADRPVAGTPVVSTFSIVAYDPETESWGISVASKFLAVGGVVPWASADAGAIATQSYANTSYGPLGLQALREGKSAEEVVKELTEADENRERRQVGIVDKQGNAANFTGKECLPWAGGKTGKHYTCQGNILAGPEVVDAMAEAYEKNDGPLAWRILSALEAADAKGGDIRGRQSAAILVVRAGSGYGGYNDRMIDFRVDDHESPIPELARILSLRLKRPAIPQDR